MSQGFTLLVEPSHFLAQKPRQGIRVAKTLDGCQKGVYLAPLSRERRMWLAENSAPIFKCYDWQQTQDVLPLFDEFSRSENTTAAGGNASLMAMDEQ